jgi:predicted phage tail component-like protein
MNEIIFNGKWNYSNFDVILNYFKPQPPAQKIIKEDVPYMHGTYDFSTIGSNGETVYSERNILCSIEYRCKNTALMMIKYSNLLEWLLSGKHELIYTGEPDMKYMAKVEQAPSFDTFRARGGRLQFEFIAEPFKQSINLVGDDTWDTFNFETDYVQDTEFDVAGSKIINLYNPGRNIVPVVNCSSSMTVILNSYTANFIAGDNRNWRFRLQPGLNQITVNGTGHIKFMFRKELL